MSLRILIIKFWALGDILMATPLLPALKAIYPDCQISWLVDQEYAQALDGNPYVEDLISFDSGTWRRDYRNFRWGRYLKTSLRLRHFIKDRRFNLVICLTAEKWWTLWFNSAPVTVGLFPTTKAGWLGRFYTTSITRLPGTVEHNTDHYLNVAKSLTTVKAFDRHMIPAYKDSDAIAVDQFLADLLAARPDRPFIVLHPGSSQVSKCWPVSSFAALIDQLADRFSFVITGSTKEAELANKIKDASHSREAVRIAAGNLKSLGETTSLVNRSAAVVTGDTSLLHIASALLVPLVAIYGSTRPGDNAPLYGTNDLLFDETVACSPCYQADCPLTGSDYLRCQTAVTPERVSESISRLLLSKSVK